MLAKDVMCKNIIYVTSDKTLMEVSKIFEDNNIGFLPVVKDKKVLGVITDRDLCLRMKDVNETVDKIISKNIITVDVDDEITTIFKTLSDYRIKRVLVSEDKHIVGVISLSDLLNTGLDKELLETLKNIYTIDNQEQVIEPKVDEFYL